MEFLHWMKKEGKLLKNGGGRGPFKTNTIQSYVGGVGKKLYEIQKAHATFLGKQEGDEGYPENPYKDNDIDNVVKDIKNRTTAVDKEQQLESVIELQSYSQQDFERMCLNADSLSDGFRGKCILTFCHYFCSRISDVLDMDISHMQFTNAITYTTSLGLRAAATRDLLKHHVDMLLVRVFGGKTNTDGNCLVDAVVRNVDRKKCAIRSYAYHMLDRLELNPDGKMLERFTDFKGKSWAFEKFLKSTFLNQPEYEKHWANDFSQSRIEKERDHNMSSASDVIDKLLCGAGCRQEGLLTHAMRKGV
eukprot:Nk52_evm1s557 gene=Nk52_evmTU1s557